MKDILDLVLSAEKGNEYIKLPQKYKNNRGMDLLGYSPEMLARAALHYKYQLDDMEFIQASDILANLKISLVVEELALIIKKSIFTRLKDAPFLKDKTSIGEITLELFSQFLNKPKEEIKQLLDHSDSLYEKIWRSIVPDEDNVSPEQLNLFYNSIPFPIGSFEWSVFNQNNLAIAYRALPILLALSNDCKKVFDFGGNTGYLVTAMATTINADVCMLIEENEAMLEFAKWRNSLSGVQNMTYKKKSDIEEDSQYDGFFDLGICTEVLEHVYDVEGTVETISRMLKKEGLLFVSASFGYYPEASHLKKNVCYSGKEEELMERHGLIKCTNLQFPIPLLGNMGVYIKAI